MGVFTETKRQQILSWLKEQVPTPRLRHILRVEQTAQALARQHDVDVEKAAQAGLLHDAAKYFSASRLLEVAHSATVPLDPILLENPHLLHAAVGAVVARDEFQVEDREVLAAISNHTLGAPEMSRLSCVVFLADGIEPGRGDHPKLVKIRKTCQNSLYKGVSQLCTFKMRRLLKNQQMIHPQMVLTRNWALQQKS